MAIDGVQTILLSLQSNNPARYILNYDEDENEGGITIQQLRNALFKVVRGRDKLAIITLASSGEFLAAGARSKLWKYDKKTGVVGFNER